MPELFTHWSFWYWVGGAIVAIAAILLIAILIVARSIAREAERALDAARRIQENTAPIPGLAGALEVLVDIHDVAGAVEAKTRLLAGVLHGEPGGARSER